MDILNWLVFELIVALVFFALILSLWMNERKYLKEHQYPGFGFLLNWKDDVFTVAAVLLTGPADLAGVRAGDTLHGWGEMPFAFKENQECVQWLNEHRLVIGDSRTYIFSHQGSDEQYSVLLKAVTIQGPIPVYGQLPEYVLSNPFYVKGMSVCKKTGVLVENNNLNNQIIEGIFRS
ncbi:MAG: hypothetical protein RLZZ230_30 [Candidatus Parcubacteria bacterium]|jgi:hypothetical protein